MNKDQQNQYEKNMIRVTSKNKKARHSIMRSSKKFVKILRILMPFVLSPVLIVLILIFIAIGGLYKVFFDGNSISDYKKVPSIVLNKEKIEALGLEIYSEGENKGKIKGCENLEVPKNIYSSFIEGYAENAFSSEKRMMDNFCLYHQLYLKVINRDYKFEEEDELIDKISNRLKDIELTNDEKRVLKKELNRVKLSKSKAEDTLKIIDLKNVEEQYFKDYEKEDGDGFKEYIDYPISYFKNNQQEFLNMLFYEHIGSKYGESFPEGITLGGGLFGIMGDDTLYYNMLTELGTKYNKENIAIDFLPGSYGLPDFSDEIASRGEYHNYPCPPCKKEVCSCTGDPEEDRGRNFQDEEEENMKHYKNYLNFIHSLKDKKVIYVSENVKSPYRDYIDGYQNCKVDVNLTQRDGPSNLKFGYFTGYPKVNGVKTHAGLDLAATDNCNGDEVPIYSVTEGIVVNKYRSNSSWGNTIIIETEIKGDKYYLRYSHLDGSAYPSIGDFVSTNTLIGIQGDTGPSTAEHLDLTIYKNNYLYESYLRDSLNWGGLFNFSFTDMIQNGFSDYTIGSFNESSCYNCK